MFYLGAAVDQLVEQSHTNQKVDGLSHMSSGFGRHQICAAAQQQFHQKGGLKHFTHIHTQR